MDLTEILSNIAMSMLWFVFPIVPLVHLILAALGLIVVAVFFVAVFRFIMWGMSGRRW